MKYFKFQEVEENIVRRGIISGLNDLEAEIGADKMPGIHDRISQLKEEYHHALEYFRKDVADDNRTKFYDDYLRRALNLVRDASMCYEVENNYSFKVAAKKAAQVVIDNHVKEVLLSKKEDPESLRKYLDSLFYALLVSPQWDKKRAEYFIGMLTDGDLDYLVVKVILSAIMLSCFQVTDYNKVYCLIQVYKSATDERIRQYALIGWVLGYHVSEAVSDGYLNQQIAEICAEPHYVDELFALQKNLFCLYTVKSDADKIGEEVFSKFMNGFSSKQSKLGEKLKNRNEELTEEDILELTGEEDMEEFANSTADSVDFLKQMDKNGADIHYAVFYQMKSYPFFHTLVNWFVPFYKQNPLFPAQYPEMDMNILDLMENHSDFCDNDKYSAAFSLASLIKGPRGGLMKEIFASGELGAISQKDPLDFPSDTILRNHIKDLIRFYNLSPMRESFNNPFKWSAWGPVHFLKLSSLFVGEFMDKARVDISFFLAKRKRYDELERFYKALPQGKDKVLVESALVFRTKENAKIYAGELLEHLEPYQDSKAVALLMMKCYYYIVGVAETAIEKCRQFMNEYPEEEKFLKHLAYFLVLGRHFEEARPHLAKLEYMHPEDLSCLRSLAWVYINLGELELAKKLFKRIQELSPNKKLITEDIYNLGLLCWLSGRIDRAIEAFSRFEKMILDREPNASVFDLNLPERFCQDDIGLLERKYGKENVYANISMMLDCINENLEKE